MNVKKHITLDCAASLKKAIADSYGNEIFALCYVDDDGYINKFDVRARGNEDSVLALYDLVETMKPMPDVLLHNHPPAKGKRKTKETIEQLLTPSDNDMYIASKFAEQGIGSYIVDNDVEHVYVIAEPTLNRKKIKLNSDNIIAQLQAGGTVALRLPYYETRDQQLNLVELIIRGFNEEKIVVAEAGTGVGKSFAYLLPAIHFALANEQRIIISTATITLQQQLFEKDIPLVSSALGKKIKTVLVKGRANYICRRRLNSTISERQLFEDKAEHAALDAIVAWAETTQTGSRSDLNFMPPASLWQRVCSESDTCMGLACTYREKCFVMSLRREASAANLLVVNHHLLFADIAARSQGAGYDVSVVLPPYRYVIIDEAHTIEKSATSFFTEQFSRIGVMRNLARLWRDRGTVHLGIIPSLLKRVSAQAYKIKTDEFRQAARNIQDAIELLNNNALELCGEETVFRLINERSSIIQNRLIGHLEDLRCAALRFCGLTEQLIDEITDAAKDEKKDTKKDDGMWEVKSGLRRMQTIARLCGTFIEWQDHTTEVLWIERKRSGNLSDWAHFNCAPISVAGSLKESLFEVNTTVICVSATLTISGLFDYWASRIGITMAEKDGVPKEILFGNFPSPFPYESAVLTAAPANAPLPVSRGYAEFLQDAVFRLTETSGGSALVLFTSFESLRTTYNSCAPKLEAQGIRCLKQGDDDRHRLLKEFVDDQSSVLFATDSFWEGVDAPGETLRMLIICRLPFIIPNDPVFEARCELIEREGGNPFMQLSVPESVMKFRQGFGRLMRRSTDRGVVAVLDGRILTKNYGSVFLRSLPKTKTCFADIATILRNAESVLFN